MLITGYGMLSGNWQNKITKEQYLELYENMDFIGHPTGTNAVKKFNEDAIENQGKKNNEFNNQNKK